MGEARLKTSLHPAIFPVKRPIDKSLCLSARLHAARYGVLCAFTGVNALKLCSEWCFAKFLIQCVLTLVNAGVGHVYQ
jgi:hypothetical protein